MEENKLPHGQHETTDVDTWAVGRFGIALAFTCLISMVLLFGLFHFFQTNYGDASKAQAQFDPRKVFPQPRLQTHPRLDLEEIRNAQERTLDTYGWVDQPNGVVRVPIDRAIDLLVQRGLPARSSAPAAPNVSIPTDSGLGASK
jgi:hypothetical protein